MTGQKYNRWTVLEKADSKLKNGRSCWLCRCECGNEKVVTTDSLRSGHSKSCGCLQKEVVHNRCFQDLTGKTFSRLTVIKFDDENSTKKTTKWWCKCNCGNQELISIDARLLKNGNTKSCGCLSRETVSKLKKKYNTYDLSGDYGIGYTEQGTEFLFDLEDYDKIKDYYWTEDKRGYIVTIPYGERMISLHRLVMNVLDDENIDIDHIYHKVYDNRKSQLRLATKSENMRNVGLRKNNTSGVTGVSFHKKYGKWRARITIQQKEILLGYFDKFEDAVEIRRKAEDKYFGEFKYKEEINNEKK